MIFDVFANAHLYQHLHPRFAAAFEFLRTAPLGELPSGKQTIDGENLFALVNVYTTQPLETCRFESHRKYVDIQLMVHGEEQIGIVLLPTPALAVTESYVAERDIAFYAGSGDMISLTPGRFAIFFPHDAHQPGIACGSPASARKVVVKVAVQ